MSPGSFTESDGTAPCTTCPTGLVENRVNGLTVGPQKRVRPSDPLVHYGQHFGRTAHAMCNIQALITNGLINMSDEDDRDGLEESLSIEDRKEYRVFKQLQRMIPRLTEQLMECSNEESIQIADLIQKGVSSARADDTKSLKGVVLDWITPRDGVLNPPLSRNVKTNRGFHHPITGGLLCPAGFDWQDSDIRAKLASGEMAVPGNQWPILVYENQIYDNKDPWSGLFRSKLLIWAFKHIFTSPSSVEKEVKATRSSNAHIHGMTRITTASIAYVSTQLRFSLLSSSVFCRSDTATDSERFYWSVLDFLDDPLERTEVNDLLDWWNRRVFPSYVRCDTGVTKKSALARLREIRAQRTRDE